VGEGEEQGRKEPEAAAEASARGEASADEQVVRLCRSLRRQATVLVVVAVLGVTAAGPLLIFAPREVLLVLVPLLFALEFGLGFVLSGKLMALSLARHHDKLREDLARQHEETRQTIVTRWLSLDADQRRQLRAKFPDIDWKMIDGLAGTDGEQETKH
jgi:hypothetical protein